MSALVSMMQSLRSIAPTIASHMSTPLAPIMLLTVAKEVGGPPEASALAIRLAEMDADALYEALVKAEAKAARIAPQASSSKPATMIDTMLGGDMMQGRKTVLGVIGFVGLTVIYNMIPEARAIMSPDVYSALQALLAGMAGLGLYSAVQRRA